MVFVGGDLQNRIRGSVDDQGIFLDLLFAELIEDHGSAGGVIPEELMPRAFGKFIH